MDGQARYFESEIHCEGQSRANSNCCFQMWLILCIPKGAFKLSDVVFIMLRNVKCQQLLAFQLYNAC